MSPNQSDKKLRRVGALWKPKPDSKSLGSGSVTINGFRQRFVVLRNDRKTDASSTQPDFVLMSSDPPEVDSYQERRIAAVSAARSASRAPAQNSPPADDIPF